jgi:hydroxyethylthiazole kinase
MHYADIIKGNASEIMTLADSHVRTLGVESLNTTNQAIDAANKLATTLRCIVAVSGEKDFITDGKQQASLAFGSGLMTIVTGMGCALSAVIAAFSAVITDKFKAAKLATAYFGLCGNLAELQTNKLGTFRTIFIDELYGSNFSKMRKFYDKSNKV